MDLRLFFLLMTLVIFSFGSISAMADDLTEGNSGMTNARRQLADEGPRKLKGGGEDGVAVDEERGLSSFKTFLGDLKTTFLNSRHETGKKSIAWVKGDRTKLSWWRRKFVDIMTGLTKKRKDQIDQREARLANAKKDKLNELAAQAAAAAVHAPHQAPKS